MTSRVLLPGEVQEILGQLVQRLAVRGHEGSIHVIGGAAIALINPDRVATQDVDGFIRLVDGTDVLAEIARDYDLESDWFNWRAQGLQPPVAGFEMWREVQRIDKVVLYAASTEALLAMKLNAARARDMADITWLLATLGVTEYDEAERIYEAHYPGDTLSSVAQERLRFALEYNATHADGVAQVQLATALREIDAFYAGQKAPGSPIIERIFDDGS
jgi:hypothetical protein